MELSATKCKVMHFGRNNLRAAYFLPCEQIGNIRLCTTDEERDLGVILSPNLKFSRQSANAAAKANSVLGMLKNTFMSRDVEIWASLYRTYVRPHLEFAVAAWNPFLKRDKIVLEKVQRRATRMPTALKGVDYETRRTRMGLTSLEVRRMRGDLIQFYKCINGLDNESWSSNLVWSAPRTGRRSQLRRQITSNSSRHNFFTNRVANMWNDLPDDIVSSKTTNEFKSRVDSWLSTYIQRTAL